MKYIFVSVFLLICSLNLYAQKTLVTSGYFNDVYREKGVYVNLQFNISAKTDSDGLLGSKNYTISVNSISQDGLVSYDYQGETYYRSSAGELAPYFDKVRIESISFDVRVNGLKDCDKFIFPSVPFNNPGKNTLFCNPENKNDDYFSINSVSVWDASIAGIYELESAIRKMKKDKEEKDKPKGKENESDTSSVKSDKTKTEKTTESKVEEKEEKTITNFDMLRYQATQLEAEGDALYQASNYNYLLALDKYKQAQSIYPTASVQQKIDQINGLMQIGQGLYDLADKADKAMENADPEHKTDWNMMRVSYEFGAGNNSTSVPNPDFKQAGGAFAIGFNWVAVSWEMRLPAYRCIPTREYSIYRDDYNWEVPTIAKLNAKGWGMGMSFGLNLPLKNFMINALYGYDMILFDLIGSYEIVADNFKYDDTYGSYPSSRIIYKKAQIGAFYTIPNKKWGVGLTFDFNWMKPDEKVELYGKNLIYTGSDPSMQGGTYIINEDLHNSGAYDFKYKFNNFGITLFKRL